MPFYYENQVTKFYPNSQYSYAQIAAGQTVTVRITPSFNYSPTVVNYTLYTHSFLLGLHPELSSYEINVDDQEKRLESTEGYNYVGTSIFAYGSPIIVWYLPNGEHQTARAVKYIRWHKPVLTTKNIIINKDTNGNILDSTSDYKQVSSSTNTTTENGSYGDSTVTNITTVTWDYNRLTSENYCQSLSTLKPDFNAKLENAILKQINNYRSNYGSSPEVLGNWADSYAHENITWSLNAANAEAVIKDGHSYSEKHSTYFINGAEVASVLNQPWSVLSQSDLSSSLSIADSVHLENPNTFLDVNYLNKAHDDSETLDKLAYSLVYEFGRDAVHKTYLLNPHYTTIGIGVGLDSKGYIQIYIDSFA
jgi:hypothetical protein